MKTISLGIRTIALCCLVSLAQGQPINQDSMMNVKLFSSIEFVSEGAVVVDGAITRIGNKEIENPLKVTIGLRKEKGSEVIVGRIEDLKTSQVPTCGIRAAMVNLESKKIEDDMTFVPIDDESSKCTLQLMNTPSS